jgi:dihydrofolate reductase
MRKIIVSNLVTLDGFFAGPNRELDWFVVESDFFEYAANQLEEVDAILYGRITYQEMAAFWPTAKGIDERIEEKMNSLEKIVFSNTLKTAEWNNSKLISGDLVKEVTKLKQTKGKDIVIFGSGQLVSGLAEHSLIDEYRLIMNPVILGNGMPQFHGLSHKIDLELLDMKKLKSGVVILYYKQK